MYVVTVTNQYDCQSIDSVEVEIIDQFQIFASPDRTICEGDTVHLNTSIQNDPFWLVSEGTKNTNGSFLLADRLNFC